MGLIFNNYSCFLSNPACQSLSHTKQHVFIFLPSSVLTRIRTGSSNHSTTWHHPILSFPPSSKVAHHFFNSTSSECSQMVCLNIIQMPSSTLEHLSLSAALPTRPWPSALLSAFWTSKFLLDWLINLCLGHSAVLQPQLQALPHSSLEPVIRTCEPWVHVYHSNSLTSQYGLTLLSTDFLC